MRIALYVGLGLILLAAEPSRSQELSTSVYPSEDEILEALQTGEIDYCQYQILLELAQFGIGPDDLYLFDEIPNLWHIGKSAEDGASLEADQRAAFVADDNRLQGARSLWKYRYMHRLENEPQSGYRMTARTHVSGSWSAQFDLRREFTGRERIMNRTVRYQSDSGVVRRLQIGTFTERYGLGTVVGYRGKLLHLDDELSSESFLFPDNGGYNGISGSYARGDLEANGLVSYTRDSTHDLLTLAGATNIGVLSRDLTLVGAVNRLSRRGTDSTVTDFKTGVNFQRSYSRGVINGEICMQAGHQPGFGAAVVEGRHMQENFDVRYAGWLYSDNYISLSGGAKSAGIQRTIGLPEAGFRYSDRRAGQAGMLARVSSPLSDNLRLITSVLAAGVNRDTLNLQLMNGLERRLNRRISLRLDYLAAVKYRDTTGGQHRDTDHRLRLEGRFGNDKWTVRSYIGLKMTPSQRGIVTLFTSLRYTDARLGIYELWSSMNRVTQRAVEYWYLYVRMEHAIFDRVRGSIKLGNTYNKTGSARNRPVLSFDIMASL
jgi:hypothetical protein